MAEDWENVSWEDVSENSVELYESRLLKLNCDKALHHLKWHSTWNFETTVKETTRWYKNFYENPPNDMQEVSVEQIESFTDAARLQGIAWAR